MHHVELLVELNDDRFVCVGDSRSRSPVVYHILSDEETDASKSVSSFSNTQFRYASIQDTSTSGIISCARRCPPARLAYILTDYPHDPGYGAYETLRRENFSIDRLRCSREIAGGIETTNGLRGFRKMKSERRMRGGISSGTILRIKSLRELRRSRIKRRAPSGENLDNRGVESVALNHSSSSR